MSILQQFSNDITGLVRIDICEPYVNDIAENGPLPYWQTVEDMAEALHEYVIEYLYDHGEEGFVLDYAERYVESGVDWVEVAQSFLMDEPRLVEDF